MTVSDSMQSSSWVQFNMVLGILNADLEKKLMIVFNKFRLGVKFPLTLYPQNDPVEAIKPKPAFAC